MFGALSGLFSSDMAIDLGTANTLIYIKGKGIVLNEPSVVAYHLKDGKKRVLAVGEDAKLMLGRTPGVDPGHPPAARRGHRRLRRRRGDAQALHPQVHTAAAAGRSHASSSASPSAYRGRAPRDPRERDRGAGARKVGLIEEPIAAAIGAGNADRRPDRAT